MDYPIQKIFKKLGEEGCYFFCVWKLACRLDPNRYHDPLMLYFHSVENRWMEDDGFMLLPHKVLEYATGIPFLPVTHESPNYVVKPNEYEILKYSYGTLAHFVLPDWDPLGDSETRRKGTVTGKRVFRRGV